MRFDLVVYGAVMGMALAAPPGVVTAETLRRGLRGGLGHALSVQAGSIVGDLSYALIALAGVAAFVQTGPAQVVAGGTGSLFLLYLAWQSFKPVGVSREAGEPAGNLREAFLSGMLLSLTNPWEIAFWASLGGSFVALGVRTATDLPLLFGSFILGLFIWSLVLSGLIERGRHLLSPRLFRVFSIACGLLLGAFGLGVGVRVLTLIVAP